MTLQRSTLPLTLFMLLICSVAFAADEAKPAGGTADIRQISYYKDIRPIFQANCHGCHQPAKQGGEYEMTGFESLLKGGESEEAAIVVGKPAESGLLVQITPTDGEAAMPKGKESLSQSDIDLITAWIEQGAKNDAPMSTRRKYDMEHPPIYAAAPVITSLDFSPDGKFLAISGYHEVLLHKADGSGLVARLVGMSERIESAVFSPDGKRLAVTGGLPGRMGEVQVWNPVDKKLIQSLPVGYDTCYGASWSGDGKLIAFGCPDNTIRAIDSQTGKAVLFSGAHSDWVLDTIFSVKSDHLITVSRDQSMKLIEVKTQRFIDNITSITPGALKGGINSIDRHPKKDELLAGGADGTPKIYRMVREKARKIGDDFNLVRAFSAMPGRVYSVAYSSDGKQIVAGSSYNGSGEVRIYNEADAKTIATVKIPEGGVFAVAFSADGKTVAAGGFDGKVRLINAADGKIIKQFVPVEIQGAVATAK